VAGVIPIGVAAVVLTGRYIRPDGTPLTGSILFEPPGYLTIPGVDVISTGASVAELDETGAFSITLIATDDPGTDPTGWTYRVVERLQGVEGRTFHLQLPAASSPVNLADIAPTDPSLGDYIVVEGPPGTPGTQIYSGTGAPSTGVGVDGDYYIDKTPGAVTLYGPKASGAWPTGIPLTSSGSSPVTSVAGKTGAVTLVVADVSGAASTTDVTSAVSAHASATDPHGDRAAASSALASHVAATDPHGDRAAASSALASHVSASDPHGDRAAASSALAAHVSASDPHGDRAAATAAIAAHAGAADPHADRAYADGKFLPLAGGTMTGGLTSARSATTDTAFAFGLATDTFDRARILAGGTIELGPGTAARDTRWQRLSAARWGSDSDVAITVAGKGLMVKEGSNAKSGVVTLSGGTATVANTSVTSTSRIQLTSQADGGTPGWLRVSARTAGTSFTITSSSASDTSTVAYFIVEPSP
jgi:hypothetical protein